MIEKSLEASILISMIDLTSQIRLRGGLIYKFVGITTQQYVVMLHLANDPNIPFLDKLDNDMLASELADSMKISRPNITNIIKTLIRKELVVQSADPIDRRQKRLRLTDKGKQLITEIEPLRKKANMGFLSSFSEEEKKTFLEYIRRCSTYAREQLESPNLLEEMHQIIYKKPLKK